MTTEEYEWSIKRVQDFHQNLNLSFEQAELIYKFTEEKNTFSLCEWEAFDYEYSIFKTILTSSQFSLYEVQTRATIAGYVESLKVQDEQYLKEIETSKATICYYETTFLPTFHNAPFINFGWLQAEKSKIDFLRAEYKKFLIDYKKTLLSNHFRFYRSYQPNQLKSRLLQLKLLHIWPSYSAFAFKMDMPTKATAAFLYQKLAYFEAMHEAFFTATFTGLKQFLDDYSEANNPKSASGWRTTLRQQTIEEEKENRIMSLLLLDFNKYGYLD